MIEKTAILIKGLNRHLRCIFHHTEKYFKQDTDTVM